MTVPSNERPRPLILFADDDETVRLVTREALESSGFDVVEAANGREALASFVKRLPDLVLLDVMMPEMDGFATCAAIRNQPVGKAVATLTFSKRRIAQQVKKALESAIANAENNHQLDVDRLVVVRTEVGRSVVMRRFHARGRGRSARIEKWFSHLKIVVAERTQDAPAEQEAA